MTGEHGSAVIPDSAGEHQPSRSALTTQPPQLPISRSAPAPEMEALIQASPSQEAFKAMTRADSFHGFSGGDTQPMDSQVYHAYTVSAAAAKDSITTPLKPVIAFKRSPSGGMEAYDITAIEKTPHTMVEGDIGFVDLVKEWQVLLSNGLQWPNTPRTQAPCSRLFHEA